MATQAQTPVNCSCDPRFRTVKEEFRKNFAERGEVGASLAVYLDGELVVDLWGGAVAQDSENAWERDTLVQVFSATKGMSATCLHVLADRGLLDFHAPVAHYWPEFDIGRAHV